MSDLVRDANGQDFAADVCSKRDRLLAVLREFGEVIVAFSGGVDSSVLARAAVEACGDLAVAATAVSPSLAECERRTAAAVAADIGIRHVWLSTQEFDRPEYRRNTGDRCFYCKDELYSLIEQVLLPKHPRAIVCNGANLDDLGDWRPGLQAARRHGVRSPLVDAGFTKADVRRLAAMWKLPVWNKPASPCLASRIAYGVEVTPERVRRVEAAEAYLREQFGLVELRVRHEADDLARIEVRPESFMQLAEPNAAARIAERFSELGFRCVTLDLGGFRSGNLNVLVPLHSGKAADSGSAAQAGPAV